MSQDTLFGPAEAPRPPQIFDEIMRALERQTRRLQRDNREMEKLLKMLNAKHEPPTKRVKAFPATAIQGNRRASGGRIEIGPDVADVLRRSRFDGNRLYLPDGQLPPKLYRAINDVIEALGGKWKGGRVKAHIFKSDCEASVLAALDVGRAVDADKALGFFRTPSALANHLVFLAGVEAGHRVLEPSAGDGAIVRAILPRTPVPVDVCEIDPGRREVLAAMEGVRLIGSDFLSVPVADRYDRIVANPPFGRGLDIDHVTRMVEHLAPGGVVVSVMAAGVTSGTDRKSKAFRALVEGHGGAFEELPEGSFSESGTNVQTVAVRIPNDLRVQELPEVAHA